MATETGYHTAPAWTGGHPAVSEQAMGRYVVRTVLEYFQAGLARTYFYELIDEGTDPADREDHFGLLRADGTPKPAYTALKRLIALLGDPGPAFSPGQLSYAVRGADRGTQQLLFGKRDGRFYLALWQEVSSFDIASKRDVSSPAVDVVLELAQPASRIRLYAPLESDSPTKELTGTASVPVGTSDSPVLVEITP